MKQPYSFFKIIRIILVFVYAVLLLLLIPTFFMNYNSDLMEKVAEVLPLNYSNE